MNNYESKRKALFDCLDNAGKDIKGTVLDQTENLSKSRGVLKRCSEPSRDHKSKKSDVDESIAKLRGKDSLFKKPELPITKCLKPRFTPDYKVNPHKWKKYSLSDVDISDHTNTAAAFAFLKEIETKKDSSDTEMDAEEGSAAVSKITFNKSMRVKRSLRTDSVDEADSTDKPKLKGSKLLMPEYVIGQKVSKEKKNKIRQTEKSASATKTRQLCLSHLDDEGEEDE